MTGRDPQPTDGEPPADDEVWRDLVSRLSEPGPPAPPAAGHTPELPGPPRNEAGDRDAVSEPEDDVDGFVPEEPPPLGVGNPLLVLAWCGAVGGPLFLLGMAMFWRSAPLAAIVAVLVLFLASVAWLVFRLPSSRDTDDDGAVL